MRSSSTERDWRVWVDSPHETIPAAALQEALDAHNGSISETSAALGFKNRHMLRRLIQRLAGRAADALAQAATSEPAGCQQVPP